MLGSYVRDRRVLALADAVRKMTSKPARRLGLVDRVLIRAGYVADLVVFDPATVAARATTADPAARPAGIERVMVGGIWVVIDGAATGARPGLVLWARAISQRRAPRRSRRAVDRPREVTR